MKHLATLLLLFYLLQNANAQAPLVKQWDYRYGGGYPDHLRSIITTSDEGYLLGGGSASGISGDHSESSRGFEDYWVVKLDSSGIKQWDKRFGGGSADELFEVQQTKDGGYLVGGYSQSLMGGDKTEDGWGADYWIIKTDSYGNKQWDKTLGGTGNDYLRVSKQTKDGGYFLGGTSSSDNGGDKTEPSRGSWDYWVIKTDSIGHKLWDKRFGGTDDDQMRAAQQTSDGGYILGGYTNSGAGGDKTEASRGFRDYWIVKIDSLGNKQWDKRYGGTSDDDLSAVIQTRDGGYYLAGTSGSEISGDKTQPTTAGGDRDYWVIKIDSSGVKLWDQRYGGHGDDWKTGNAVQTLDNGFLFAGKSDSPASGDKTENGLGFNQTWIIKTTANGVKKWDKTALTPGQDIVGYGVQTADGCYAFANYTSGGIGGNKTQASRGSDDFWIVKFCDTSIHCNTAVSMSINANVLTAYNGIFYQWYLNGIAINGATSNIYIATQSGSYTVAVTDTNACVIKSSPVILTGIDNINAEDVVSVYPNPLTDGGWQLTVGDNFIGSEVEVFDANGKLVFKSAIRNLQSAISPYVAKGVYLLRISSSKNSVVRKLIRL